MCEHIFLFFSHFILFYFILKGLAFPNCLTSARDRETSEPRKAVQSRRQRHRFIGLAPSAASQKRSDFPERSCLIPSLKGSVAFEQSANPLSKANPVCILKALWDSRRASRPVRGHRWLFQMKELVCLCFNYLFLQDLPSSIAVYGLKEFN